MQLTDEHIGAGTPHKCDHVDGEQTINTYLISHYLILMSSSICWKYVWQTKLNY